MDTKIDIYDNEVEAELFFNDSKTDYQINIKCSKKLTDQKIIDVVSNLLIAAFKKKKTLKGKILQ
jgi:hypothetical protein